jgi:two-component system, response regulator
VSEKQIEILLVEDNPDDVELTLHALRKENLANNVEIVRDGEDALNFLFCRGPFHKRRIEDPPRLVLLDLKLPKVDGLSVLRQLKASPLTRAIPVVILTASREEKDMVESYQLGVNSYIQKPVDFQQFQQTVKEVGLFWLVVNVAPPAAAFTPTGTAR